MARCILDGMETDDRRGRWIGYATGPGGKDHLPADVLAEVERLEAARRDRQGHLLCEVLVQVYEHDAVPQVSFPAGSTLDLESSPGQIAAAVAQARDALASWR
jgi:hypothetical protein